MKYRKKLVEVEAFQLGVNDIPDWFSRKLISNEAVLHERSIGFGHVDNTTASIKTFEGWEHVSSGDYIILGTEGEIYSCEPDIFEATYERVYEVYTPPVSINPTEEEIVAFLNEARGIRFEPTFIKDKDSYGNPIMKIISVDLVRDKE